MSDQTSDQADSLPAVPDPGGAIAPADSGGFQDAETSLAPRKKPRARRRRNRRQVLGGLADGDHSFDGVQHKLTVVIQAMTAAVDNLEGLDRRARATAKEASNAAGAIANAELDETFVGMTEEVATAQMEAAKAVRKMLRAAQRAEKDAYAVRRAHAKLYGALHRVRRGRRHRTPKPGFFHR
ncbi:conjugal transfer protein TraB [Kitasatospora sp. NPDC002965]|uniref:conjugal transfer protein TraB n=1 Tax=Kitasatospora sp. NPDC002965 TaxID=3154775 RepID=UPI00339FF392